MPPELDRLRGRLEQIVGTSHMSVAGADRARLTVDGVQPVMIVRPGSQEEVADVMAACAESRAAVIPWGGGTAMGLGTPPARGEVALCLERLDRVVEHDAPNLTVTVEAGCTLAALQARLEGREQFLPLDAPAERKATMGGLLASNASGPGRLLYGTARDWVLGMRVVLPSGERMRCGGKVIKNVSGYDMTKLFIGSLGSLGVITEATFKLLPAPAARAAVVGVFAGLEQTSKVVARVLDSVLLPESMELLDPDAVVLLGPVLGFEATGYGLAVSLAGSRATVDRQVQDFTGLFQGALARDSVALEAEKAASAWETLRNLFALLPGPPPDRVECKLAVSISQTANLLAAAHELGHRHGLRAAVIAHAGSGIVRACYLLGPEAPPAESVAADLDDLRRQAEQAEGSLVLRAAPRAIKTHLDVWGKPRKDLEVMRRLKAQFDPQNLCNPGRFPGGI